MRANDGYEFQGKVSKGLWRGRRHRRPVRWDLVRRVRRDVARGTYETADKLQVVADRLMAVLDRQP